MSNVQDSETFLICRESDEQVESDEEDIEEKTTCWSWGSEEDEKLLSNVQDLGDYSHLLGITDEEETTTRRSWGSEEDEGAMVLIERGEAGLMKERDT